MLVKGEHALQVHIEQAGYSKEQTTIHDIQFALERGQLLGIIGPNGAGKSTTIKSILGLLASFKGEISFADKKANFAYIPEHPVIYDGLTMWEHLVLAASVYEMPQDTFETRAEQLLTRFKLTESKHELPANFSKGMQQKLMLIIGFLNQPDVYIVDEPFIGLDPHATKDLLNLLNEEKERGASILMSTHVLDTAERICDGFVLIAGGTLVANGTLDDIRTQCGMPEATLFDCFHELV
ncbi:ABC transporter ATP-binding protein [Paenibacillus sp. N1-5-1-14]|uniref:ABC transporter ATP-binding protein n=1 Tax=Paenibacillus radicibacter TaxID=2972488 RepID=UPI002159A207|nr:ABC transporter ATP-binding protein [Paenibacillus radicibacter]MCR8645701.1 ABC transporter ATP-binding protein [Paenibacillus radicibacter]